MFLDFCITCSYLQSLPIPEVTGLANGVSILDGGQGVIKPPPANKMVPLGIDVTRILIHCIAATHVSALLHTIACSQCNSWSDDCIVKPDMAVPIRNFLSIVLWESDNAGVAGGVWGPAVTISVTPIFKR